MNYLKLFKNHLEYEEYVSGHTEEEIPIMSHCIQEAEMHYNEYITITPIIYMASEKLIEETSTTVGHTSGLHINNFSGSSGQLTMISHTFENGVGTIKFNDNVTKIGNWAFYNCDGMTNIEIPDSVTSIGNYAFDACTSLTSINIPSGVTSIGDGVFKGYSNLTSITIDRHNTVYDSRNNCNAIIETATNKLVFGCKNSIIPNTVTSISDYAFNYCTSLTNINIPNGVTSIGKNCFSQCSGLTSIDIPDSVTSIGSEAFFSCVNLTSAIIGTGVTSIGNGAFSNCKGIKSINIPNGVTSIGDSTFQNCGGLTSMNIPNSVTRIGLSSFNSCSGLTSCTIGDGVTYIDESAFAFCSNLATIISLAMTAPTITRYTFRKIKKDGILYVPQDSIGYDAWMQNDEYYLGDSDWELSTLGMGTDELG